METKYIEILSCIKSKAPFVLHLTSKSAMASEFHHAHFVLIPLMSPGHIIPMVDMAKLLARRGVTVTLIMTQHSATRFASVVDRAIKSGLPIRLLEFRFPSKEAGLPEGCDSVDDIPSYDLLLNFFNAIDMSQNPLEQLIEHLEPNPSCIVCDKHIAWTAETAKKFNIPRIIFDGMSCFSQLCVHNLHVSKVHERFQGSEPFVLPGLPDEIVITRAQLPGTFNPGSMKNLDEIRKRVRETEKEAYGVVVNSFEELEQRYVNEYKKVREDRVWCIGPLSLCSNETSDMANRGNTASIDANHCFKWLDSRQPRSVIYACLGSLSRLTPPQFIELALGLESTNQPFILVIKAGDKVKEIETWISENGFEERTRERGLLIRGWAPQVLILSHAAVGAFLTHCGWNSTLEAVCAGVPLITWPLFSEQFLNEKFAVQVLKIGESVGARVAVGLGEEEKSGVKVEREEVEAAARRLMEEGEEGGGRRRRARELAEMAKRAVEEGGSSHLNMTVMIQDIVSIKREET